MQAENPLAISFRIEYFDSLASTQDAMKERLAAGKPVHGLVIRAGAQSRARGRRAFGWSSGPGGSYQTLALRDPAPPSLNRGAACQAIAVGLAEAFPEYGAATGIKWPNDLYYLGKKLAGILCEYKYGHLLIGVGVNVENEVPEGAAALRGWDPEGVSSIVLDGIQRGLALLEPAADLPRRYEPYDLLFDMPVTAVIGGDVLSGTAQGITEGGCLKLARPSGLVDEVCRGHLSSFGLRSLRG